MQRRKLLAGLGSLAAGAAAATGTGAFSRATAQREIELTIQPDDSNGAYLNFSPTSEYAEYDNGVLKLSFRGNGRGQGLTSRGNTLFEDVFTVENQGTTTVDVVAPSFASVNKSTVQQATAAASTNFLVDSGSAVSDFDGVRLIGSKTESRSVDSVDISWPRGISPSNKPSNPIPQNENLSDSGPGRVKTTYTGLRYPGGAARLDPGEEVDVDVRFTISNARSSPDERSAGALYRAVESPAEDSDWQF